MRIKPLHILIFFSLIAVTGISSGALLDEHTTDEWRSILAVSDNTTELTGLQISLSIDPDQYYLPQGSAVNLSGVLTTIFGPVRNAPIILARGNNTNPVPYENLTTDENGTFSSPDTVNTSGIVRYQVWFEGSDIEGRNITKSSEIEIRGVHPEAGSSSDSGLQATAITGETGADGVPITISGTVIGSKGPVSEANVTVLQNVSSGDVEIGSSTTDSDGYFEVRTTASPSDLPISYLIRSNNGTVDPADDLVSHIITQEPVVAGDQNPVDTALSNKTSRDTELTLQVTPETFTSGQNITLSGVLTGTGKTPLPHVPISIEKTVDNTDFVKIGDTIETDLNGSYSASYHLTGPSSPSFRAVSSNDQGNNLMSDAAMVTFQADDFSPRARERKENRHIDADLSPGNIQPGENITLSGWFSDGNGDGISDGRLNLYWYNFADRIWDRYENSSEAITNDAGYYAFNVSGPDMTGVSYMAVVSRKETTGKALFSRVLPLTVRGITENSTAILPAILTVKSNPAEVQVSEKAQITFTLTDPNGNPLVGEPVKMFFSEDGFTWFMNGSGNVTTRSDGTVAMIDTPKIPGFHYYRGVYDGSELFGPADSGILALVITAPQTQINNSALSQE